MQQLLAGDLASLGSISIHEASQVPQEDRLQHGQWQECTLLSPRAECQISGRMDWAELNEQLAGDTQQRLKGLTHLEVSVGRLAQPVRVSSKAS